MARARLAGLWFTEHLVSKGERTAGLWFTEHLVGKGERTAGLWFTEHLVGKGERTVKIMWISKVGMVELKQWTLNKKLSQIFGNSGSLFDAIYVCANLKLYKNVSLYIHKNQLPIFVISKTCPGSEFIVLFENTFLT